MNWTSVFVVADIDKALRGLSESTGVDSVYLGLIGRSERNFESGFHDPAASYIQWKVTQRNESEQVDGQRYLRLRMHSNQVLSMENEVVLAGVSVRLGFYDEYGDLVSNSSRLLSTDITIEQYIEKLQDIIDRECHATSNGMQYE